MAIEKIRADRGTALPLPRRQHRHRSHHPGALPAVGLVRGPRAAPLRRRSRPGRRPGGAPHPFAIPATTGAAILARQRELRLRLVARARAAGDPAPRHPRGRRRIVLGDLLRQLGRARHAVRDGGARGGRTLIADGARTIRRCRSTIDSVGASSHRRRRIRSRSRMPAAARDGFLDGSWDATGLLLERYEEVEAVAARLPYVGR